MARFERAALLRKFRGMAAKGEPIISHISARDAEIVQARCDHSAGFSLNRGHAETMFRVR